MNPDAPHPPGADPWWSEAWHLDAASADGTGLTVRLECFPNQNVAWVWTYLVLPDRPGPVVVRDHEVPLPRQGLEVRAEGLWVELWCEAPLDHWTYGLEAFGLRLDDPADALREEIGERVPVGLDIEWEAAGAPHTRAAVWPVEGFVQPGIVHGEVLLGRSRIELDCTGERRRSWGVRDFTAPCWTVAGEVGDLTFHVAQTGGTTDGFVGDRAVEKARMETHRNTDGLPVAGRCVVADEWEIDIEVLGLAPVMLAPGAPLARALCQYTIGSESGVGWSTWFDPT
ncbi:MAG: hypothetical protein SGJ13_14515 [Actinomycetota bacterium]|nr:hypothetical protein [Actinomycetota bacterium]